MSENRSVSFKNILKETNRNEFYWATRMIYFINAYRNDSFPPPKPCVIKERLLKDEELYKLLEGVPKTQIKEIVNEIASSFSLNIVRWLGYFLVKILSRTVSNLYVNETRLVQIRSSMGSNPVIFLPTHRSYGDFILMAFICFHYSIQLPYVAAGMDFHSMKVMGEILRNCKAFFMRRKFADDRIYRTIFEKYFHLIMELGESPIEFFIEGTRSRSAKSLSPKFGLLTMALDAYVNGLVPDITVIPISISYDRVLEEELFAYELLGIPKPKESTMGLFNAFRKMKGVYGDVFFNFGQPINVRDWIGANFVDSQGNGKINVSTVTHRLAHHVIERQSDLQIYGIFNVLAIVMSFRVWNLDSYSILFTDAVVEVEELCGLFKRRSAQVHYHDNIRNAVINACRVHSNLVQLVNGTLTFKKSSVTQAANLSEHKDILSEESICKVVPVIMLQLYINPCLHLFVTPALVLFSFKPAKKLFGGSVQDAFTYITQVFKYEFVTLNNVDGKDLYNEALMFLRDAQCVNDKQGEFGSNNKVILILLHLLQPFVTGYRIVVITLLEMCKRNMQGTPTEILLYSQKVAQKGLAQGLVHPYCLSRDMLKNALFSFCILKYITKNETNGEIRYLPNEKLLRQLACFLDQEVVENSQKEPKCRL
ncbi:dihydroxyacetone phosphate acyltransferase isoform X2 [Rhodnius prolixus]|uniref:dihydroxyacetone phosphate acyltransferase isoform X2 n=1 Tax=Rhodnius prolixus TaxID=13249 RepID=UPI003D18DFD5